MDFTQIIPTLGSGAFTLIFFVIALSVIVAIHEYGHYIVGRWSGIHADVFSVGFGKVLVSKVDRHGTKWQLAALPFGGYVKFAGDANAAGVGSTESVRDPRNTMTGAPLWARAATVAAGPLANFILAAAIFAGYYMYQGSPTEELVFESAYELPASYVVELEQGDVITNIGGLEIADEARSYDDITVARQIDYTVIRDGEEMVVSGPMPIVPRVVGLTPRSAADDAGLRVGDVITGIDGTEIFAFSQIIDAVLAAEGTPLMLEVLRDDEVLTLELAPRRVDLPLPEGGFETRWMIGVSGDFFFEPATDPVGAWEGLKLGADQLWRQITTSLSALYHIFSGAISTCNLSGPVGIAQASGSMAAQGAQSFVLFIGMLSTAVGLINLFPIPILDGGHLVFHAYEAVSRRKPTEAALRVLMVGGLSIVLTFMAFAILNDLVLCP